MPRCRFPLSLFHGIFPAAVASRDSLHHRRNPALFQRSDPLLSLASHVFRRIYPVAVLNLLRKQKSRLSCNFFAIEDSLHPDNAAISLYTAIFAAFLGSNPRLRSLQQSLIAKSCNQGGIFVSEPSRQLQDGAVSKVCPAALRAA